MHTHGGMVAQKNGRNRSGSLFGKIGAALVLCGAFVFAAPAHAATLCASLLTASLPNATVTSAVTLSGTITGPDGQTVSNMPEFCKVTILATPTSDSSINIELWMPTAWNGRFEGTGNGGYAGTIAVSASAMIYAIKNGWATVGSDMGTAPSSNNNGDALIGHPQKWIDFGSRATALSTTLGKQVIALYYGKAPDHSYFNGCSTGGQQALMLAQQYPDYYDGILAGSPANDRTHVHTNVLWIYAQAHSKVDSNLNSNQVNAITNAVVNACAAQGGGLQSDTFLTDARNCSWKPSDLQCPSGGSNCLNADQVAAVSAIYAGPMDPVWKDQIFEGSIKGSENATLFGWNDTTSGNEPQFDSLFKWAFGAQWQYSDFDYHQSRIDLDSILAGILNDTDASLTAFRARGGKLLQYHGFADPLISPGTSIDYFTRSVRFAGNGAFTQAALDETQKSQRLFMVPGMNHCGGGPGPNVFGNQVGNLNPGNGNSNATSEPPVNDADHHALLALVRWVEQGVPPEQLIATKYNSDTQSLGITMQRPLCVYPKMPHYVSGDPNAASSFTCTGTAPTTNPLSAVLPASRSVQVGKVASAFATIINNGQNNGVQCSLSLGKPVAAAFSYQTTDPATNVRAGTINTPVDIAAGKSQSFVFALVPTAPFDPVDMPISAQCINTLDAPLTVGLNTLLVSGSVTPVPDIVALAASIDPGYVDIAGNNGAGAFAVSSVNVGIAATITASADTGAASLPISVALCQTNAQAQCTSALGPTVMTTIAAGATPTFSIFVQGAGAVTDDPANNRVFVRFKDANGVTRGSTSVAVRTH